MLCKMLLFLCVKQKFYIYFQKYDIMVQIREGFVYTKDLSVIIINNKPICVGGGRSVLPGPGQVQVR